VETSIILTDDCLLLFEESKIEKSLKRLIFWCYLFSIIDLQINRKDKIIILRVFNDSKNREIELKLKFENILFFREALIKRIKDLNILTEHHNLKKGDIYCKNLTDRDINNMLIDELKINFKKFHDLLDNKKYSFYNVNSFFNITKKIVEYLSARNEQGHFEYLEIMKSMLQRKEVKDIIFNRTSNK